MMRPGFGNGFGNGNGGMMRGRGRGGPPRGKTRPTSISSTSTNLIFRSTSDGNEPRHEQRIRSRPLPVRTGTVPFGRQRLLPEPESKREHDADACPAAGTGRCRETDHSSHTKQQQRSGGDQRTDPTGAHTATVADSASSIQPVAKQLPRRQHIRPARSRIVQLARKLRESRPRWIPRPKWTTETTVRHPTAVQPDTRIDQHRLQSHQARRLPRTARGEARPLRPRTGRLRRQQEHAATEPDLVDATTAAPSELLQQRSTVSARTSFAELNSNFLLLLVTAGPIKITRRSTSISINTAGTTTACLSPADTQTTATASPTAITRRPSATRRKPTTTTRPAAAIRITSECWEGFLRLKMLESISESFLSFLNG